MPCDNIHPEPLTSFIIDPEVYLKYETQIHAIIHSHPDGPAYPTETDMQGQLDTDVPWGIVCTDGKDCLDPFFWGDTVQHPPFVGRGFRHGVTDCYELIRDFYREHGVDLPVFPRDWRWWDHGGDLYKTKLKEGGFKVFVQKAGRYPRKGDLVFMQIGAKVTNHAGIYLGNDLILHHMSEEGYDMGALSTREPITKYHDVITFWARHEIDISTR